MTLRDILNPWAALREARAEIACWDETLQVYAHELGRVVVAKENSDRVARHLRDQLDRLQPKRDAKTGRFV